MHTKQALWYRPVRRPSAEEMDLPFMGSVQALQVPFPIVGRATGSFVRDGGASKGGSLVGKGWTRAGFR